MGYTDILTAQVPPGMLFTHSSGLFPLQVFPLLWIWPLLPLLPLLLPLLLFLSSLPSCYHTPNTRSPKEK